jgi:hypothetical protein
MIGAAIHSTSTTVFEDFPKDDKSPANYTNEFFHGPLSHSLFFMGAIATTVFLALLEINHPDLNRTFNSDWALVLGMTVGLIEMVSIIWSTFIKTHLVASMIATAVIFCNIIPHLDALANFPIAVFALVSQSILSAGLLIVLAIYSTDSPFSKKFIKIFFPNGYPHYS